MIIDTLSIARELKAAALPPEQAEAIAAAIGRAVTDGVATKTDLDLQEQRLTTKIETVRSELKAEIETVRSELKTEIEMVRSEARTAIETLRTEIEKSRNQIVLWVIGSQISVAALIIALIKL